MLDYWKMLLENPHQQLFTYKWEDKVWHYAPDYMIEWCKRTKLEVTRWAIDPVTAAKCYHDGGVEQRKLDYLLSHPQDLNRPIVMIEEWNERRGRKSQIIVDGNHRFVCKFITGKRTIKAWVLSREEADQFAVDVPPELSKLFVADVGEQKIDVDKIYGSR